MPSLEIVNELTLRAIFNNRDILHIKTGSMLGYQGKMEFSKELIGPGRNVIGAALSQLGRRFTGENMALTKAVPKEKSVGYFAFDANHVVILDLEKGETIAVESENILAFTDDCKYGVMFMPLGTISQKGLATSTLTGPGQAAILIDGNPIVLTGECVVDPDALVAFRGPQPSLHVDLSWKMIIPGQTSGESYSMHFKSSKNIVILQPKERMSGINIGMDGGKLGSRAEEQQRSRGILGGLFGD